MGTLGTWEICIKNLYLLTESGIAVCIYLIIKFILLNQMGLKVSETFNPYFKAVCVYKCKVHLTRVLKTINIESKFCKQ